MTLNECFPLFIRVILYQILKLTKPVERFLLGISKIYYKNEGEVSIISCEDISNFFVVLKRELSRDVKARMLDDNT